jgi:hypothetical protein
MSTTWTVFWRNLGIKTIKRSRTVKNYNVKRDYSTLHRIGVNKAIAEAIYQKSAVLGDSLFFNKLSLFFGKGPETVKVWLNATSKTDAFDKLFKLINPNNLAGSKSKFAEIDLIYRFHAKGEGRYYEADYPGATDLTFNVKSLIFQLNRIEKDATYCFYGKAQLGPALIYCIQKDSTRGMVFKFIKLTRHGSKLRIAMSMDSTKEYNVTIRTLEKWFNVYIDTPQSSKSLEKIEQFILTGDSPNFVLVGVTYFNDNFKFTITDIYNRVINVGNSVSYNAKMKGVLKKTETVSLIKIFHKNKVLIKPIPINILSYKTAGIVGAVKLVPNDRNLNETKRKLLYSGFKKDFGISLNEFITYNDLDELGIYKIFLEGTPQRLEQIDLRSKLALSIYQGLLTENLLKIGGSTEEQARFCVNRNCEEYYKIVWERKFCNTCGQALINGKKLVTQTIDESSVMNFIYSSYNKGNVTKLSNKLLKRDLFVAKIESGEHVAEFIPMCSNLKDHQIEVLKFRYTNLVIVTSQDNLDDYERQGIHAVRLYELVHNCKKGKSSIITEILQQANDRHLAHTRALCRESVARISNNNFYKEKNAISKYLGAELFEADCTMMMNYIFGNSIWLGAHYRGRSLPDGFTAFPMQDSKNGCFIWDSKYGEGKKLQMGKFIKNKDYIISAKKNKSIKDNGGLKGFVFISNQKFPKLFETRYVNLVKGSRLKVTFLSAEQLRKITEHFRKYETRINNNEQAKTLFMKSMSEIFFNAKKGRKCEIIDDTFIDSLLKANAKSFNRLKAGTRLTL